MIAVTGKKTRAITRKDLEALRAAHDGVTVDLGSGDGRFAYRYAVEHPRRLVIAIDPVAENMRELSAKAARKPERGGAPNALFVVASVEMLPAELDAVADELQVLLPWGSLMRGLILGDRAVLDAVARMCAPGASIRIVLNTRIFDDPVPIDVRDLPELTPDYVNATLTPLYAECGMRIDSARWMDAEEVAELGTTWAKRLSHRSPPRSVVIAATRVG